MFQRLNRESCTSVYSVLGHRPVADSVDREKSVNVSAIDSLSGELMHVRTENKFCL